ncbi:MAG TPA: HlyD family efflux transporter periplasmic adaptor subunit [Bacteroidetes bacterium]|nr:HlyD family efflux transporter periplasmic adaptor subunit [Bacteroidota bacterium]
MAITNPSDIRLNRQDDLEAIIGNPPGWTMRWGMTVLFLATAMLLTIAWFVSYPDIVEAGTVLTTEKPPIRLVAGASARIIAVRARNGDHVLKDELLGILESPAEANDVLALDGFVQSLSREDPADFISLRPPENLQLGSLQAEYARFKMNFEELQYFIKQDINFLKISNLRKQIIEIENVNSSLAKQIRILEKEVQLYLKNAQRDSTLLTQNAASELEYEQSQTRYFLKKRELENLRSQPANNRLEIKQLQAQILDLRQRQSDAQNEHLLAIKSDIQALKGEIDKWKQTWLLIAPIDGKVALTSTLAEQQFLKAGQEVMTVIPTEKAGNIIAKALLAGMGSGKVKDGMDVHIRLEGFPYQEFGVLNGKVKRIAEVPGKNGYELEIELTDGMTTSYGKEIPFRQEMAGTARVITEERSLLMRILEDLRAAFEK